MREDAIAACMGRKGFFYAPEYSVDASAMTEEEGWNEPDPNGDYMNSLSPSRLRAYSEAYAGLPDLYDEGFEGPIGGCLAAAYPED